jgi:hypothetical protein
MIGACTKCGKHEYVMPLHGDRGGPLFCILCAGAWNAEHGRLRRARRIVIKALKAYQKAGGRLFGKDFDQLMLAAGGLFVPVGYEAEAAGAADFSDLTTELLDATVALTHPDKHPLERKAEANRVTRELLALRSFVFPAPQPDPPRPQPPKSDASSKEPTGDFNKPSPPPYPCEDCRNTISDFYCDPCKAEFEKQRQRKRELKEKKRQIKNTRQRSHYKAHKEYRERWAKPTVCATCAKTFKPKRADAKYCSAACRQRAYVKRDGKASNSKPLSPEHIEQAIRAAFTADPNNAFTVDDLCDRVYLGLKQPERKHRAAVIPIAKKVCESLGEWWEWWRSERPGGTLIFLNRASVTSYAMARLKSDYLNGYRSNGRARWSVCTEERLRAEISPGGRDHALVVEGGAWWEHCQEAIAKFKQVTPVQNSGAENLNSRHAEAAP